MKQTRNLRGSVACIRYGCLGKLRTTHKHSPTAAYAGLNVVRRRVICTECGSVYYTIEVEEEDFKRNYDMTARRVGGRI